MRFMQILWVHVNSLEKKRLFRFRNRDYFLFIAILIFLSKLNFISKLFSWLRTLCLYGKFFLGKLFEFFSKISDIQIVPSITIKYLIFLISKNISHNLKKINFLKIHLFLVGEHNKLSIFSIYKYISNTTNMILARECFH